VADDSPANRLVAVKFVEKLGYHADAVASGPEALAALRKVAYDLVLMDCQMPDLDGFETTRNIRSGAAAVLNRAVPIIALTACALNGDREACCAAGMDDYLTKPVDYAELAAALDRCLRTSARPGEAAPIPGAGAPPVPRTAAQPLPSPGERPASADSPLFDCAGFVQRLMGDLEMADLVAQSFLADMPGQIQALKAAVDSADATAATKVAHRVKGASSAVGGSGLQRLAYSMELAGKSQDLGTLQAILPQVAEEFEGLRQLLERKPWQRN
jgi:CheY-like chemotaxis protein